MRVDFVIWKIDYWLIDYLFTLFVELRESYMTLSYIIYFQRREDKENFFYSHFQISGRTYYTQLGSKKEEMKVPIVVLDEVQIMQSGRYAKEINFVYSDYI